MGTEITKLDQHGLEELRKHTDMIVKSGLVPAHFEKYPTAIPVCIRLAQSIGEEPVQLMQACYFIGGKMGLSSQYLLGRLRRSGSIIGTVHYEVEGEGETLSVRASAIDATTGEKVTGPAATMEMAKADGWTKNPKYKSMPEIMLHNRALSFLVRYHYPDSTAGLPTTDELQDVQAAGRATPAERTGALAAIEAEVTPAEPEDECDDERKVGFEDTETQPLFEAGE